MLGELFGCEWNVLVLGGNLLLGDYSFAGGVLLLLGQYSAAGELWNTCGIRRIRAENVSSHHLLAGYSLLCVKRQEVVIMSPTYRCSKADCIPRVNYTPVT